MQVIRPATLQDFDAIYAIAKEQCQRYEKLRIDNDKLKATIRTTISSAAHFSQVSVKDGRVTGALLAVTTANTWAQKQNVGVILWTCSSGMGAALLRRLKAWAKPRRGIRVVGMAPDLDCDGRAWALAEKLGFDKSGGSYLLYN